MKRNALPALLLTSALILAGCGGASAARGRFGNAPLTPESKLAIGTLNLETTPQAVDPAMAASSSGLRPLASSIACLRDPAPESFRFVTVNVAAYAPPAADITTMKKRKLLTASDP